MELCLFFLGGGGEGCVLFVCLLEDSAPCELRSRNTDLTKYLCPSLFHAQKQGQPGKKVTLNEKKKCGSYDTLEIVLKRLRLLNENWRFILNMTAFSLVEQLKFFICKYKCIKCTWSSKYCSIFTYTYDTLNSQNYVLMSKYFHICTASF